jgi:hypothetical protein
MAVHDDTLECCARPAYVCLDLIDLISEAIGKTFRVTCVCSPPRRDGRGVIGAPHDTGRGSVPSEVLFFGVIFICTGSAFVLR